MSSRIIDFYRHLEPDSEGRMLSEYWSWDDTEIESIHDFIQWMFPLAEASSFNPDAPLLTPRDQAVFRADPLLKDACRKSLVRFLNFLGLEIRSDGVVGRASNFENRINVWRYPNHNWLRITRLLKSLRLLGLENEAREVWKCLQGLHKDGYVTQDSFKYWQQAADGLDAT